MKEETERDSKGKVYFINKENLLEDVVIKRKVYFHGVLINKRSPKDSLPLFIILSFPLIELILKTCKITL